MKKFQKPRNSAKIESMKYKGQDLNMQSKWNCNSFK